MPDKPENIRELIDEIEPESILPDSPPHKTRDILGALFSARARVGEVNDRVPAWWSPARDRWMWELLLQSDVLSGAIFATCARLSGVPVHIRALDDTNRNYRRVAMWSDMLLTYYWMENAFQIALDWQTQDNGCFVEIMGAGDSDQPIEPTRIPGTSDYIYACGLRVLDAQKSTRTGDPDYPVVYLHKPLNGPEKYYKFHKSRVMYTAQMPSSRRDMRGVGLSGASRCVRNIIRLDDFSLLEDEIIGARPISQMIFSRGISAEDMEETFKAADEKLLTDVVGEHRRTARTVFLSAQGPAEMMKAASVEAIDLKKLPEGYNPEITINIAMNIIAMSLGFDAREFWPATVRGATRADAEVQDTKARRKTPGIFMTTFSQQLNRLWCPSIARAVFDQQDDEQDSFRATIRQTRAGVIEAYLRSQAIDRLTAWQMMLADGDLTEEQYAALQVSEEFAMIAEEQRLNAENLRAQIETTRNDKPSDGSSGAPA